MRHAGHFQHGPAEQGLRLEGSMTTRMVKALPHPEDRDFVDRVIGDKSGRPGALLGIL